MNQPSNHTNQTQTGSSFPSQQSAQTNPFTADLKGEFTSGFGTNTNTNAVSQIFKDGSFGGDNRTKMIIYGVGGFVVVALLAFLLLDSGEESMDDPLMESPELAVEDNAALETPDTQAIDGEQPVEDPSLAGAETAPMDGAQVDEAGMADPAAMGQEQAMVQEQAAAYGAGPVLLSPADGSAREYNELSEPATFTWEGGGGTIVFSRHRSMQHPYMRVPVSGNSYAFYHPYPGTWYWQVLGPDGGASEVRSFYVENPVPRNVSLKAPMAGGAIPGSGGLVEWTKDSFVAFYRVEFSADGTWGNPAYRFASSSESIQTEGMTPGQYQMRLGAFSEVAGRWEYSEPVPVTVN